MIKSELSYNPYLLETEVKFNGQTPRINSLVEKYQYGPLQNWVRQIPDIFHDELNGYNFELEFSGTKLDFQELSESFRFANVTEDMVRLFHKNELDGRYIKMDGIEELLCWLQNNPNRNLDFDSFKEKNYELFDSTYPYILLHSANMDVSALDNTKIVVEKIENIEEIINTNLKSTPIVFYINNKLVNKIQEEIKELFKHKELSQQQFFFLLDERLDKNEIERILRDIGIGTPQIVEKVDDNNILKYIELYSVSEYIYKAIKIFSGYIDELNTNLEIKIKETEEKNRDIYNTLNSLKIDIENLKNAKLIFENRDNVESPIDWDVCKTDFLNLIRNWKNKKTKLTKVNDAVEFSNEFLKYIRTTYYSFILGINNITDSYKTEILDGFKKCYLSANVNPDFSAEKSSLKLIDSPIFPDIANVLLDIKTEEIVFHKDDILGKIIKKRADDQEMVIETTYNLHKWREYATYVAEKTINPYLETVYQNLCSFFDGVCKEYIEHIDKLIRMKENEKDKISEQLSDEDQLLQNDANWLTEFRDQLEIIERK